MLNTSSVYKCRCIKILANWSCCVYSVVFYIVDLPLHFPIIGINMIEHSLRYLFGYILFPFFRDSMSRSSVEIDNLHDSNDGVNDLCVKTLFQFCLILLSTNSNSTNSCRIFWSTVYTMLSSIDHD